MDILRSVKMSDQLLVESALRAGACPNTADESGYSLLHWACQAGDAEIAALLIRFGADVNLPDREGFRPLEVAINCGQSKTAMSLITLSYGLDVEATRYSFGFLHACAAAGDSIVLERLLEHPGAFRLINLQDEAGTGRSPLHWAAQTGDMPTVELLLRSGADPNIFDGDGFGALHIAAGEGHLGIVSLFVKQGVDVNQRCPAWDGGTCLHHACVWEKDELFQHLLALRANESLRDDLGRTPRDYRSESTR